MRVAFRCDGDDDIGAGHVARCLPLARAFERLGRRVEFRGRYAGLAAWLLESARASVLPPEDGHPCGVPARDYGAAVVDSYALPADSICELAVGLPVVTIAEASRCPHRGVLLDYHLDRDEQASERLLAGPAYAPLDPAFAGAGRAGSEIRTVLVSVGGARALIELRERVAAVVAHALPGARLLLAGGAACGAGTGAGTGPGAEPDGFETAESETKRTLAPVANTTAAGLEATVLPARTRLLDVLGEVDLAVGAAGLSAYELACAGVPQVAIAAVPNQRRVARALRMRGIAPCVDFVAGEGEAELASALELMRDEARRGGMAARGRELVDGRGARRAAVALAERFRLPGAS